MKVFVAAILDKAVGAYLQPMFFRTKPEAIRSFSDACQDEKSNFFRHSADYTLMYLGEFDDATGLFASREPVRIIAATECVGDPVFYGDKEDRSVQ